MGGPDGLRPGLTLHNDICLPYFPAYCDDEQKQRWLPGIARELITAVAMTEPGIGSDLASMSTRAIRDGERYVVDGAKTFITNGINADLVITAKTDPAQRHRGISLLVVESGTPGFGRGRNLEKLACTPRTPPSCISPRPTSPSPTAWARRARASATSSRTSRRSACRSPSRPSRRPPARWSGRWPTSRSARPSASRSGPSSTRASRWPRSRPRSTSGRCSSTAASSCWARTGSRRRTRRRRSGGARRCRAASWTAACSCTAATGT